MPDLNPAQREAVRLIDRPLLVLAGAGSGKTRVITRKIAWLVQACDYAPEHIAAVTFTNKAAREMKARAAQLLRGCKARPRVSTFHTLGLEILREHGCRLGYRPGFTIFDSADSLRVVQEILRQEQLPADTWLDRARWGIGRLKNDFVSPEQARSQAETPEEAVIASVYEHYQTRLQTFNALDFDDLIVQPVRLFEKYPDTLGAWRERIRYLLVDEYQDTNACQYRLVRLLAGQRRRLTVVGDDDQSIYAWRGARPENLQLLAQDFPELHIIKLEQNYRSSANILRAANHLIANNPHAHEKRLWSALGPGEDITVLVCEHGDHEAARVCARILHHRFRHGLRFRDYAILLRSNHQARPFERALREHNIPYVLSGGQSFFDRTEIKDVMAYMRLLANPGDDAAFLRAINTPRRGIGAGTIEALNRLADRQRCNLMEACESDLLEATCGARAARRLREFSQWRAGLAADADRRPAETLRRLLADIDYDDWLDSQAPDPQAAQRRKDNVAELLHWLEQLATNEETQTDLAGLIAALSLSDGPDADDQDDSDAVRLMTLHAAKGLEFDHVFLAGMEEGLLPHRNSIDDSLEEERRLAYVGITRARKSLTLSHARRRKRYGEWHDCTPSRFIDELPAELLHVDDPDNVDDATRRERGRSHLANLRALLDP